MTTNLRGTPLRLLHGGKGSISSKGEGLVGVHLRRPGAYGDRLRTAGSSRHDQLVNHCDPVDCLAILAIALERFTRCGHDLALGDCCCDLEYARVEREMLNLKQTILVLMGDVTF